MQAENRKTAYITGGTKGIGLGIAQSLLAAGYNVAITGRKLSSAREAALLLSTDETRVLALESDVGNAKAEREAIQKVINKFGKLDVLIANAGVGYFAAIDEMSEDLWNETINTNLTGVFHTVRAGVEEIKRSRGYIITIASLAGTNFFENGAAYNASKYGLVGFTQAIMLDLRKYGVKVTTIMPGSVTSHFNNHIPNSTDAWKIQPEDIGELVVDLLKMNPRALPSKIEIRPAMPPEKNTSPFPKTNQQGNTKI
ncbi:MAG: SDR family oxidoreductase [Chitinophagaceae bacterium]|nr:SDR family oxidoreductase [Bacteroidota bacterium]MCC6257364.1 SDR family oxidoreductase [Chitinophagaceae bacterium]